MKLNLSKETVVALNSSQSANIQGGWTGIPSNIITLGGNCTTNCTNQVCATWGQESKCLQGY